MKHRTIKTKQVADAVKEVTGNKHGVDATTFYKSPDGRMTGIDVNALGIESVTNGQSPAIDLVASGRLGEFLEDAYSRHTPNRALSRELQATGGPRYKNDKHFADECVTAFLSCSQACMEQAREAGADASVQQDARRAWAAISRARLFMVKPDRWGALYSAADRYTESLVGSRYEAHKPGMAPSNDEAKARLLDFYTSETAKRWPFPDPLPFESCFFAYGLRLVIDGDTLVSRAEADPRLAATRVRLLGNLLSTDERGEPYACAFLLMDGGARDRSVGVLSTYRSGEWYQPASLDPWILNSLVHAVNEHKQIVQDYAPTLGNRLDKKKAEKHLRTRIPLPAPYYLINLADELITPQRAGRARLPGASKLVEWSHRWDQRAHEAVRISRGPMPIDPAEAAKLRKRGYTIYEGRPLSSEDANRLVKRGVRGPSPDEWMAVKSYQVEACVKGPADKPYVPGARIGV